MENTDGHIIERPSRSSSRGVKRILKWIGRGLLAVLALIFGLVIFGLIYESVMSLSDSTRFIAPGQMMDVNGQAMHINCVGEGATTVILEAGFGAWTDGWTQVQPEIGSFTRVCSYDRAGLGWSAVSAEPRTPEQIAQDLHNLLTTAGIQPPYVLVGHSLGGKSIRLFTELYPDEVSGLMFVDARHESVEPTDRTPEQDKIDGEVYVASFNLHRTLRQFGVVRLFGASLARSLNPALNTLPDDVVYRLAMFGVRESTIQTMIAESADSTANDDQLRAMHLPSGLPITVLTAQSSLQDPLWERAQHLAALSDNSEWIVVENSGHNIQDDQPEVVIDAVRAMVNAVR